MKRRKGALAQRKFLALEGYLFVCICVCIYHMWGWGRHVLIALSLILGEGVSH